MKHRKWQTVMVMTCILLFRSLSFATRDVYCASSILHRDYILQATKKIVSAYDAEARRNFNYLKKEKK
jgi:hypothetical protein